MCLYNNVRYVYVCVLMSVAMVPHTHTHHNLCKQLHTLILLHMHCVYLPELFLGGLSHPLAVI